MRRFYFENVMHEGAQKSLRLVTSVTKIFVLLLELQRCPTKVSFVVSFKGVF